MEEIYISMKEASDLEGIPYATFSRWISQKEIDGTIEIQKETLSLVEKSENTSNLLT